MCIAGRLVRLRTGSLESQRGLLQFNSQKVIRISHELITIFLSRTHYIFLSRTHYILYATNSKHFSISSTGSLDSSVRPEVEVENFQSKAVSLKVHRNTEMVILRFRLPLWGVINAFFFANTYYKKKTTSWYLALLLESARE